MLRYPAVKAHYQVTPIPGEGVLLLSEAGAKALHGSVYEAVVPLLDGRRSSEEVVDALAGRVAAAKVYYALLRLEKNGYIGEHAPELASEETAFWHGLGLEPRAARTALGRGSVNLIALTPAFAAPVREALAELGVAVATPGQDSELDLVLTDDYWNGRLSDHNRAALASGRRWLLARPCGLSLWLGPLFVPGRTACFDCLRPRLERNQFARGFAAQKQGLAAPPPLPSARLPATLALAARLLALEAAKVLAGRIDDSPLLGQVLSLDLASLRTQPHQLVRDPFCAACGEPTPAAPPAPLELVSRPVAFVQDGGHRSVSPDLTLRRFQHLVSPITGAVRLLEPLMQADGIAHVYVAGHNAALRVDRLDFLKRSLRHASGGKGISDTQARASALCEALERDAALFTGREYRITARYHDLGADAIHPNDCMLFSERQYRERAAWNARRSRFNWVPEPFDEERPLWWSPVWSLTEGRHRYLPTQYVYFQAPAADDCAIPYCVGCSNGNASGNNREEAVLQGFCELAERDAVALWWYNRLPRAGVDLASFGEPYLLDLVAYYEARGRDVWALDITSDLGLPTFVAIARRRQGEERILFGMGCHLDARIALQRACAEMNQMLGAIADMDDPASPRGQLDEETLAWLRGATLADNPYLAPAAGQAPRRRDEFPRLASGDLLQDIHYCRDLVAARGMEMLVHDLTRPGVGLPAVKVIVPGLRHFWARFAPGRLYDVPAAMGWLPEARTEQALNPIPLFI